VTYRSVNEMFILERIRRAYWGWSNITPEEPWRSRLRLWWRTGSDPQFSSPGPRYHSTL